MGDSFEMLRSVAALLGGTFLLRPYVAAFLAVFLVAAARDLGGVRAVGFLLWGALVSLGAELSSTRVGFPFGLYHYTGETAGAEMYFSNVPFFSTLSFPFLAYASFCLARAALGPEWAARRARRLGVVALAGVLMTLLDVVIDPLAVRGERWFLGHVFFYPEGGVYFGVPLSNFGGWLLVGWATVGGYVLAAGDRGPGSIRSGIALYYAILAFNLGIALWIGEPLVAAVGIVVHLGAFLLIYIPDRAAPGRWSAVRLSTTR
ncbi:MAG TPA: carotenoid biosynthesis protein [Methylomirabilota bacterium]